MIRWLTAVSFLTALLAGYTQPPQHRDLFEPSRSSTCMEVADGRVIYLGGYAFRDASGEPVIDGVSLVGPNGLELTDARVVPIVDEQYPAFATYTPGEVSAWRTAKPAVGQTIIAQDPSQELMFGVERTLPIGTASGVRVDYHIGGRKYYAYWPRYIGLVDKAGKCKVVKRRSGL